MDLNDRPSGEVVAVVMMAGLAVRVQEFLRSNGWDLADITQVTELAAGGVDVDEPMPTYGAVIPPGSPLESLLRSSQ